MFSWLKSKGQSIETITTSINYYDSPTDVTLYWDDVLDVLSLAEDGSEGSVRKLKQKYNLEDKYGNELYVTLNTPKPEGYTVTRDHYPGESWDFSLKDLQKVYEGELEYRAKQIEWKKEKQEKENLYQQRNSTENLQKRLKDYQIKREESNKLS
ncbi:hypothetical protein [Ornithinibacillus sp. JPR2-1]|uniref:hypothetical protein n=1 Tax=Ornithinibacillus sp. JPR2-1 TaxID=2094019 RepID=UPI0031DA58E3